MSGWNPRRALSAGLALLSLLLGLLAAGCPAAHEKGKNMPPPPNSNGRLQGLVLRISQRNEPGDLDPATSSLPDEFFIIRALGEGLVAPDPAGGPPTPAAAESWEISADGLAYTFHLRHAFWSDGTPVTAADFVESYRRVLNPATASPKASLFLMVSGAKGFLDGSSTDFSSVGIRALDSKTLEIRLLHPMPGFLDYAASGPWIPVNPSVVRRHGQGWTRPGRHVGNGPYVLEEWQPHRSIVLRRRADYWDAEHVSVDCLQFSAFDNSEAEERAFRAGQVDVTMALPPQKISVYRERNPGMLRQSALLETRYLSFNTRRTPLDDPRVRQALGLSIDREELCSRVLIGGQVPAARFLHPSLSGIPSQQKPLLDVGTARRLLAEAGFPGGKGFPVLELSGWSSLPVLEAIQAMWLTNLGIETKISVRDAKVHVGALTQGRYDVAMIVAIPDVNDPLNILEEFKGDAPGNYPHWNDTEYGSLVSRLELSTTSSERSRWVEASETRLLEESPVSPLYFNTRSYLVRPRVQGWTEDGLWNRFYKNITLTPEYQPE